jgi:hypothetical protein
MQQRNEQLATNPVGNLPTNQKIEEKQNEYHRSYNINTGTMHEYPWWTLLKTWVPWNCHGGYRYAFMVYGL